MTSVEQLALSRRKALEAMILIQARLHELEGAVARDPTDRFAPAQARIIGSLLASIARGEYPFDAIASTDTRER